MWRIRGAVRSAGAARAARPRGLAGGPKKGALSDFVAAMLERRGGAQAKGGARAAGAPAAAQDRVLDAPDDGEALPSERAGAGAKGARRRRGARRGPFAKEAGEAERRAATDAEVAAALAEANRLVESATPGAAVEDEEAAADGAARLEKLSDTPLPTSRVTDPETAGVPIPLVAKSLRRVVSQPGTHPMHDFDDRKLLHFPEYFSKVYQPEEIDWRAIPPFTTSSRDERLLKLARKAGSRVASSTSSTTSLLAHLYFMFLRFRHINVNLFSPAFSAMPRSYTRATKAPSQTVLRKRGENLWGMDSGPRYVGSSNEILMKLGKSMEYGAVMEPGQFQDEMVARPGAPPPPDRSAEEHFRYIRMGNMMMRSQLDAAKDKKGNYVFDLKTRATNPIRMNIANYRKVVNYRLTKAHGLFHSFEREWFDMARSAFLKYVLQCRIGQMQGVMVTFHNTQEVFGFEHIPLSHMEEILFGGKELADAAYNSCTRVLDRMLCDVTDRYKDDRLLKLTAFANRYTNTMTLFVERVLPEEADADEERRGLLKWLARRQELADARESGDSEAAARAEAAVADLEAEAKAREGETEAAEAAAAEAAAAEAAAAAAAAADAGGGDAGAADDAGAEASPRKRRRKPRSARDIPQQFPLHRFCLQNHLLRLDWMSTEDARRRLLALGEPAEGPRAQLIARLEEVEKEPFMVGGGVETVLPTAKYYKHLVDTGRLVCYEMEMKHYVGGDDGTPERSRQVLRRSLTPSDVGLINTKYGFREVTSEHESHELAQRYRRYVQDINSEYDGVGIPVPAEGEEEEVQPARHLTHPPNRLGLSTRSAQQPGQRRWRPRN